MWSPSLCATPSGLLLPTTVAEADEFLMNLYSRPFFLPLFTNFLVGLFEQEGRAGVTQIVETDGT